MEGILCGSNYLFPCQIRMVFWMRTEGQISILSQGLLNPNCAPQPVQVIAVGQPSGGVAAGGPFGGDGLCLHSGRTPLAQKI
eukprot:1161943-Pelagomonas_calceolata.AAC.6